MKNFVLTVTLNPALDRRVTIQNFKFGEIYQKQNEVVSAGGKGLNVSRSLQSLGVKTFATGILGGCAGVFISKILKKEKIDHQFLEIKGETRTNLTIYDPIKNKMSRILEEGPNVNTDMIQNFLFRYSSFLKNSKCVVISGRNARKAPDTLFAKMIELAKIRRVPTFLDTSGRALKLGLKAKPDIIKPNLEEAEEVLKMKIDSTAQIKTAVKKFHDFGVETVLLSMGAKGAVASENNGAIWLAEPPATKSINEIGCGDAFVAGFLAAYFKQRTLSSALTQAVAAGTANSQEETPGLISKENLVQLSKRMTITQI